MVKVCMQAEQIGFKKLNKKTLSSQEASGAGDADQLKKVVYVELKQAARNVHDVYKTHKSKVRLVGHTSYRHVDLLAHLQGFMRSHRTKSQINHGSLKQQHVHARSCASNAIQSANIMSSLHRQFHTA